MSHDRNFAYSITSNYLFGVTTNMTCVFTITVFTCCIVISVIIKYRWLRFMMKGSLHRHQHCVYQKDQALMYKETMIGKDGRISGHFQKSENNLEVTIP